jgi:hypothetical protein
LSKALDGVCCFCICCHAKAASPNVLETNIGSPACAPFPASTSAQDIAYKALAVNLSDLAAMGATPLYFTLALSLPSVDKKWAASPNVLETNIGSPACAPERNKA